MTNKERARIEALVKGAPPLRKRDLEAINRAFPAYIFRVRKTGEVWTTCCGRHETIGADAPAEVRAILDAPHQREPKKWDGYCCHAGYMSAPPPAQKFVEACPWCGHEVKVKELGRTGDRQNLHGRIDLPQPFRHHFDFCTPDIRLPEQHGACQVGRLDRVEIHNDQMAHSEQRQILQHLVSQSSTAYDHHFGPPQPIDTEPGELREYFLAPSLG